MGEHASTSDGSPVIEALSIWVILICICVCYLPCIIGYLCWKTSTKNSNITISQIAQPGRVPEPLPIHTRRREDRPDSVVLATTAQALSHCKVNRTLTRSIMEQLEGLSDQVYPTWIIDRRKQGVVVCLRGSPYEYIYMGYTKTKLIISITERRMEYIRTIHMSRYDITMSEGYFKLRINEANMDVIVDLLRIVG